MRLPLGWFPRVLGDSIDATWQAVTRYGAIGPNHRRAQRFARFGSGSAICFPPNTIYGERNIAIGENVLIGPGITLSAGVMPEQDLGPEPIVHIGDGTLIGRGSGIVAHAGIQIGAHVFTGHHIYITDCNHGYEDVTRPIGAQFGVPEPITIGDGAWIGHGAIVLPGAQIGAHTVIGAGSVVRTAVPDRCVAVGNPARVVRRYVDGEGWVTER
ncbi:MAG: acyltransferase [Acidimicrobiia bacterium]